ncbi:MAG: hypothetical protein AAFO15_01420, partial [Pseudomonadota bacterium]
MRNTKKNIASPEVSNDKWESGVNALKQILQGIIAAEYKNGNIQHNILNIAIINFIRSRLYEKWRLQDIHSALKAVCKDFNQDHYIHDMVSKFTGYTNEPELLAWLDGFEQDIRGKICNEPVFENNLSRSSKDIFNGENNVQLKDLAIANKNNNRLVKKANDNQQCVQQDLLRSKEDGKNIDQGIKVVEGKIYVSEQILLDDDFNSTKEKSKKSFFIKKKSSFRSDGSRNEQLSESSFSIPPVQQQISIIEINKNNNNLQSQLKEQIVYEKVNRTALNHVSHTREYREEHPTTMRDQISQEENSENREVYYEFNNQIAERAENRYITNNQLNQQGVENTSDLDCQVHIVVVEQELNAATIEIHKEYIDAKLQLVQWKFDHFNMSLENNQVAQNIVPVNKVIMELNYAKELIIPQLVAITRYINDLEITQFFEHGVFDTENITHCFYKFVDQDIKQGGVTISKDNTQALDNIAKENNIS